MVSSKKVVVGVAVSLALAGTAHAEDLAERRETPAPVIGHAEMMGRANPRIVDLTAGALYRHVYTDGGAYLQAGGALTLNPQYVAPQAHVQWSPIRMFTLRAEYQALGLTGNARSGITFDSRDAAFGDSVLDAAAGRERLAHKVQLSPMLHGVFGPVHVKSRTDVAYYRYSGDGPYHYEVQHDSLVAHGDVLVNGRWDVHLEAWRGGRDASLQLGPMFEMTRAIRSEVERQRIGGSLAFVAADTLGGISRPSLFAEAGVNVSDVNREGQGFAALGLRAELQ